MKTDTPEFDPGVYSDIPDDVYFALPYASKSKLWRLRDRHEVLSRDEWLAYMHESPDDKYELNFGRFFDDLISSGGDRALIESRFAVYDAHKTACKAYWKAQAESDKTLILEADWMRAVNMRDSMSRHPLAAQLLNGRGEWQTTLVWDEPNTGVRCKGRVDRRTEWSHPTLRVMRPVHVDIKTTKSCEPAIFDKQARILGFFLQAAHYLDGTVQASGSDRPRDFAFLVVEKEPIKSGVVHDRHPVRVFGYSLDGQDDEMQSALRLRDELLREYAALQSPGWKQSAPVHKLHMPWGMEADHEPNEHRRSA